MLLACLITATLGAVETASDDLGAHLRAQAIWTSEAIPENNAVHGAFRKDVDLKAVPAQAPPHLFAATRYVLWINGTYALRGPARFELQAAEFDTWMWPGCSAQGGMSSPSWSIGICPRGGSATCCRV